MKKNKQIFTENLPKLNGRKEKIDWNKCENKDVFFIYNNLKGNITIKKYNKLKHMLTINYNDKEFEIKTDSFIRCKLGRILNEITSDFKIEIGTRIHDDKRDITITDRKIITITKNNGAKQNCKYYKYTCNKCKYDCGKHYSTIDEIYKEELWIEESHLIRGQGCSCCCRPSKIVVKGINDIYTTNPELIKYFVNIEDTYKFSIGSNKKVLVKCINCRFEKEMTICDFIKNGINCSKCSDGISYPEKFMFNVLEQLKIDFEIQLSKTNFNWCDKYKYDFSFIFNNERYIVETHGLQHYEDAWNKLEKTQENDKLKYDLAIKNGIKIENYIVIDCRKSELEWIRNNEHGILNSRLSDLFDLSIIDWLKCEEFALSSRVKEACELWNSGILNTLEIANIMKLNRCTIIRFLKQGKKINFCDYNSNEQKKIQGSLNGKASGKPIELFKDGISLGVFESARELERQSEKLLGVKFNFISISNVCLNKQKEHKGYTFKFV